MNDGGYANRTEEHRIETEAHNSDTNCCHRDENRLDVARRFGATDVIDSTKTNAVEAVHDLLRGGADHVFDFVGLKSVAEQGLSMLGLGGGLYLVGVVKLEVNLDLNIFDAIGRQKRVQGVNFGSTL